MGHHNIKPQSRWLEQQKSIPHSSGGKKSKIKAPEDLLRTNFLIIDGPPHIAAHLEEGGVEAL